MISAERPIAEGFTDQRQLIRRTDAVQRRLTSVLTLMHKTVAEFDAMFGKPKGGRPANDGSTRARVPMHLRVHRTSTTYAALRWRTRDRGEKRFFTLFDSELGAQLLSSCKITTRIRLAQFESHRIYLNSRASVMASEILAGKRLMREMWTLDDFCKEQGIEKLRHDMDDFDWIEGEDTKDGLWLNCLGSGGGQP